MEFHKELLHAIVDRLHLVITHHPDDLIHVNPTHPKWKKTTIYAKEHFLKSKIQKKNSEKITDSFIKSMSRRLLGEDIVSLCLCLLFFVCAVCCCLTHKLRENNIYKRLFGSPQTQTGKDPNLSVKGKSSKFFKPRRENGRK